MADSDYTKKGGGAFASSIALDAPIDQFTTVIPYTRSRLSRPDGIQPGMAAMVGDEIMRVDAVAAGSITVRRGCADTVPAAQPAESVIWIFGPSQAGSDKIERSATETVAVKISPFTIGGGGVLPQKIPPQDVTFNWRFFRPYPPAHVMVNGARFTQQGELSDASPSLHITWNHRDRILQADQLIGHDDDSVGPEVGTTYTVRIVHPVTKQVVRTEVGIVGTEFTYWRAQALHDLGNPNEVLATYFTLVSSREGFDSMQGYACGYTVYPAAAPLDAQVMPFDQRVVEAPYAVNVNRLVADPQADHALIVGARPSDRMADAYEVFVDGANANLGAAPFTPWITSNFRLPELETTITIRSMSLFDGVPLDAVQAGHLALVDDEFIQVVSIDGPTITVRRGCLDTVPAVHIAGARIWLVQAQHVYDTTARAQGSTPAYKLRPVAYGAAHALADLVTNYVPMAGRAKLPYAPGRIVVNGRPWFEEALATAGSGVTFSWARRNRVSQAGAVLSHVDPDVVPEDGQVTHLTFYYETPAANPGDPAQQHVLRDVEVAGTTYTYGYALAQADGLAAGQALGICGTVVIYCRIFALRAGLVSWQSYYTAIRVPSYPC